MAKSSALSTAFKNFANKLSGTSVVDNRNDPTSALSMGIRNAKNNAVATKQPSQMAKNITATYKKGFSNLRPQ